MNKKELNLKIFKREKIPGVFFQPRIEPWYYWHEVFDCFPEKYKNMTLLEFYDELDLSMRYVNYYTGMPYPIDEIFTDKVRIKEERINDEELVKIISTPSGDLIEKLKLTTDKIFHTVEFPVKNESDIDKLIWLTDNTVITFNRENFEKGVKFLGARGEPQFWLPKSPYQALCLRWMKTEDFIYALADYPEKMEKVMTGIDESYNRLYQEITSYGKCGILNFGENIHAQLLSPEYFEKYLLPFYKKRSNQLRKAGIYTHIHIDGFFKPLLKYLKDLPFDGIEALTPLPQGDVSLEEIKENIGDKILMDVIPAVLFLPYYSREEFETIVKKIIDMFYPRLILGISDELPQGAGEESIERVKWVSNYCKNYAGAASTA